MITSIILGSALVLLIILMIIREIEIRRQRPLAVTVVISGLDPFCARVINSGLRGMNTVFDGFQDIMRRRVFPFIHHTGKHLHFHAYHTMKHTHRLIRGHKKIGNRGGVNFFFHTIGEHKKDRSKHVKIGE